MAKSGAPLFQRSEDGFGFSAGCHQDPDGVAAMAEPLTTGAEFLAGISAWCRASTPAVIECC